MLSRRVRVQAVIFTILGLIAAGYVAVHYVGFLRLFGVGVYRVDLELPAAGGIFPNAEVDYRGVPVGRVGNVTLTARGVQAQMLLSSSAGSIPANVQAVVADRSVIGEQYVDLRPRDNHAPYLRNGSVIGRADSAVPPSANGLLTSVDALLRSIPLGSMRTDVEELGTAFSGSAANVHRLIESSRAFLTTADRNFPQTAALIDFSRTVLATQIASASSIRSFSANLRLLSGQLAASDADLRGLLRATPPAARTAAELVHEVGTPLGVMISNLTSAAEVSRANVRGIQELLVRVPRAVDIGSTVVGRKGAKVGLTLTFFDPLPCTQGYAATQRRSGLDTTAEAPLNTSVGCTSTNPASDVRGAQHAPANAGSLPPWLTSYTGGQLAPVTSLSQLMGS
jgi:phospholipid/cholesterol/gamma-HCH transport system substrate-binding protein